MSAAETPLRIAQADGVLTLTLDRGSRANALDPSLTEALLAALEGAGADVRLAVIRGEGAHFCAGFDMSDIETTGDGELLRRFVRIETLLQAVYHAPFPTLALAHGRAMGAGADLFAACTTRIAAPGTSFRMPGWQFGIALGTRRLAARIGAEAAQDLLRASRAFDADEALPLGFVQRVLPPDAWDEAIAAAMADATVLSAQANRDLLGLTVPDTRDADLAALVRTAGRPGLQQRILAYRDSLRAARPARA